MPIPPVALYGGVAAIAGLGGYQLVTKVILPKWHKKKEADAAAAAAAQAQAPAAPPAPLPQAPAQPPPVAAQAAQPSWLNQQGTQYANGMPIMTGDAVRDLATLLAWHGAGPGLDSSLIGRFQQSYGLPVSGYYDQPTIASLATALQARGIPMPPVTAHRPNMPGSSPRAPLLGALHAPLANAANALRRPLAQVGLRAPAARPVAAPVRGFPAGPGARVLGARPGAPSYR